MVMSWYITNLYTDGGDGIAFGCQIPCNLFIIIAARPRPSSVEPLLPYVSRRSIDGNEFVVNSTKLRASLGLASQMHLKLRLPAKRHAFACAKQQS